jgi:hypothetical protein
MIEINRGTLEERVITLLQKKYPITVYEVSNELNLSDDVTIRVLKKFQVKGIVELEPLSDRTYIRLKRTDFSFIAKKRQKKFIKHSTGPKKQQEEYDGIMYS